MARGLPRGEGRCAARLRERWRGPARLPAAARLASRRARAGGAVARSVLPRPGVPVLVPRADRHVDVLPQHVRARRHRGGDDAAGALHAARALRSRGALLCALGPDDHSQPVGLRATARGARVVPALALLGRGGHRDDRHGSLRPVSSRRGVRRPDRRRSQGGPARGRGDDGRRRRHRWARRGVPRRDLARRGLSARLSRGIASMGCDPRHREVLRARRSAARVGLRPRSAARARRLRAGFTPAPASAGRHGTRDFGDPGDRPTRALEALLLTPASCALSPSGRPRGHRPGAGRRPATPGAHGERWATALGVAAVVALCGPIAYRYVVDPPAFFGLVKIDRDFRGFALDLAWRLAHAPPDARHLILVERNHPGYLGNPLLDFYLRAYGLADRVVLRGFADPSTVARLAATCRDGCRGVQDGRLESALGAGSQFAQAPLIRKLIDLREPMGTWPANVEGVSLVLYSSFVGAGGVPGLRSRSYRGFVVFEPAS